MCVPLYLSLIQHCVKPINFTLHGYPAIADLWLFQLFPYLMPFVKAAQLHVSFKSFKQPPTTLPTSTLTYTILHCPTEMSQSEP